uniref:hypothetical protein n=1 Tax=Gluconobacter japonicus TaxID=376620 RepID=UPI0039ECAF9C
MRALQTVFALSLLMFGVESCGPGVYTPETTSLALKADPSGVAGRFKITVREVVWQNDRLFLISDENHRDPRTIVVMIDGDTARDVLRGKSQTAEQYFLGHDIQATGLAKRVRIFLKDRDGNLTRSSYEQTRVVIGDATDLDVLSR